MTMNENGVITDHTDARTPPHGVPAVAGSIMPPFPPALDAEHAPLSHTEMRDLYRRVQRIDAVIGEIVKLKNDMPSLVEKMPMGVRMMLGPLLAGDK